MKNSRQFLDAIMAKHGLTSDYQLAKFLGIRQQRISIYRHHGAFDDDTCIMVAAALDTEPSYVMACIAAERTKSAKAKAAWQHAAELLGGIAACLALVSFAPALIMADWHPLAHLDGLALLGFTLPSSRTLYIMSNVLPLYSLFIPCLAVAWWRSSWRDQKQQQGIIHADLWRQP